MFGEDELEENSVVKDFFTTAADGKQYQVDHYNLDVIISVGYRVKSLRDTQFRQWATARLKEQVMQRPIEQAPNFVVKDEKMKALLTEIFGDQDLLN